MGEAFHVPSSTEGLGPDAAVTLTLDGPGMAPGTVPISVVSKLLEAVQTLAWDMGGDPSELSLVAVREGSMSLDVVDRGAASAAAIGAVIAGAQRLGEDGIPPIARKGWDKLVGAVPPGASLMLSERTRSGVVVEVEVTPRDSLPVPQVVNGRTTVYGQVRSAILGANRATVWLDAVGHTRLMVCEVSEGLARDLARDLGQTVSLEGTATWAGKDLALVAFKAERRGQYQHAPLTAALERLADASSGRWDGVDADAEISELRWP